MSQGGSVEQQKAHEKTHGVTFPVFGIVNVNPPDEHPVFTWLKGQPEGGGKVGWNFTKWLVGRDGTVIGRWEPNVSPETIRSTIENAL
jgi:glutathione peroxidase